MGMQFNSLETFSESGLLPCRVRVSGPRMEQMRFQAIPSPAVFFHFLVEVKKMKHTNSNLLYKTDFITLHVAFFSMPKDFDFCASRTLPILAEAFWQRILVLRMWPEERPAGRKSGGAGLTRRFQKLFVLFVPIGSYWILGKDALSGGWSRRSH